MSGLSDRIKSSDTVLDNTRKDEYPNCYQRVVYMRIDECNWSENRGFRESKKALWENHMAFENLDVRRDGARSLILFLKLCIDSVVDI